MFEAVINIEDLEGGLVKIGLSLNFKLFYNGGEVVCDAASKEV